MAKRNLKLVFSVEEMLNPQDEKRVELFGGRQQVVFELTGDPNLDKEVVESLGVLVEHWLSVQLGVGEAWRREMRLAVDKMMVDQGLGPS